MSRAPRIFTFPGRTHSRTFFPPGQTNLNDMFGLYRGCMISRIGNGSPSPDSFTDFRYSTTRARLRTTRSLRRTRITIITIIGHSPITVTGSAGLIPTPASVRKRAQIAAAKEPSDRSGEMTPGTWVYPVEGKHFTA